MRPIKFRGKTKEDKWVYGSLHIPTDPEDNCYYILEDNTDAAEVEVINSTIGQFTGLSTNYGQMIYENDVLRYRGHFYYVKYCKGSFIVSSLDEEENIPLYMISNYSKVIGVIYGKLI